MFSFFRNKKNIIMFDEEDNSDEESINPQTNAQAKVISSTITSSIEKVSVKFKKPYKYTGNRHLYDDGTAKKNIKLEAFSKGKKFIDPYTGKELVLTKSEAKIRFGKDWVNHLAEGDHIVPIEKVFNKNKDNVWISNDDIKETVNSKENMQAVSRKFNNAKRSKMQDEFVDNDKYLKDKDVKLTKKGKEKALEVDKKSQKFINDELGSRAKKNVLRTGHEAGKNTALNSAGTAATMSSIINITAVIKGEKDPKDALADVVKDTGKAATSGYVLGGGMTTLSHTLSGSSSTFLKALSKSNVPGNIITAVVITGNTITRYAKGEITTEDCIIELGERGLNFAATGTTMAIGQALIPIPIVGGAVGALVGSLATSQLYNNIINTLKNEKLEHEERLKLIKEAQILREQLINYREELELYLNQYFKDYKECFSNALFDIKTSLLNGDADGVIFGANQITAKLGGNIKYRNMNEFYSFLSDDEEDEF